jgi:exopolysaccharide biosynthesis protein
MKINWLSYPVLFTISLSLATTYSLLDTFVIARSGQEGSQWISSTSLSSIYTEPVVTQTSYIDEQVSIEIDTIRRFQTQVYVATINTQNHRLIKAAFGQDTYGRNFNEKTSVMATRKNAILAINGDYYGFREVGFVVRNGIEYRTIPRPSSADTGIVLDDEGALRLIRESQTTSAQLQALFPWQVWSFGPTLISESTLRVDASSKVPYELASNPRTAMGQVDNDTYLFVTSDGRTSESDGLSLLELALVFEEYGAQLAYNLDGGGSATMWFNGRLVNKPTNSGSTISERSISDIIYIGYEH